jgi:serine/threonine protein kinase
LRSSITEADIEKEIAVIVKVCMAEHQNIVQVIQHDWFESSSGYFIDMELCSLTLHDYIHNRAPFIEKNPDLANHGPIFVSDDCSAHLKLLNIWSIINHIAQGLEFIHQEHYTHRDIKPLNSTSTMRS